MTAPGVAGRIREEAARLLEEGSVDVVIGFEEGTLPMRASPCFVADPGDAGRLVWNAFCSNNLSGYLPHVEGRVGIVAKGCDTRALVELVKERQVRREDIVVIGIPCSGMADPRRLAERLGGERVTGVEEDGDVLVVTCGERCLSVPLGEVLHASCKRCSRRNPVTFDILAGEPVEEPPPDAFEDVDEFAASPREVRLARITEEMNRCIRCHACRSACPLCYCTRCFAADNRPQWVGRGTDAGEVLSFHLMRVMHLAGRCVECGACVRACPMGIDLGLLNRRVSADALRLYGCRPGLDPDAPAPLSTFDPGDGQGFILEP